jgi:phosphate transport system ATP-binding protein
LRCFNRINERYGNVTTTGKITILEKNIYDPDVSLRACDFFNRSSRA